jgi:hypothetical protein
VDPSYGASGADSVRVLRLGPSPDLGANDGRQRAISSRHAQRGPFLIAVLTVAGWLVGNRWLEEVGGYLTALADR